MGSAGLPALYENKNVAAMYDWFCHRGRILYTRQLAIKRGERHCSCITSHTRQTRTHSNKELPPNLPRQPVQKIACIDRGRRDEVPNRTLPSVSSVGDHRHCTCSSTWPFRIWTSAPPMRKMLINSIKLLKDISCGLRGPHSSANAQICLASSGSS